MSEESEEFLALFRSLSCIPALLSSCVVLTGLVFSDTISSRRPFTQIIFCISLCDMLGCTANMIGFPQNGTNACSVQAFMYLFFFPASWIWTTTLVYQLRCMLKYKKIWIKPWHAHIICWSIALVLALVPLSTNTFGQDDYLSGRNICNLGGTYVLASFYWYLSSFISVMVGCFVLMTFWIIEIAVHYRQNDSSTYSCQEISTFQSTKLYPVAMCVVWLPLAIFDYLILGRALEFSPTTMPVFVGLQIFAYQYGTLMAFIFFTQTKEPWTRWKALLFGTKEDEHSLFEFESGQVGQQQQGHHSKYCSSGSSVTSTDMTVTGVGAVGAGELGMHTLTRHKETFAGVL